MTFCCNFRFHFDQCQEKKFPDDEIKNFFITPSLFWKRCTNVPNHAIKIACRGKKSQVCTKKNFLYALPGKLSYEKGQKFFHKRSYDFFFLSVAEWEIWSSTGEKKTLSREKKIGVDYDQVSIKSVKYFTLIITPMGLAV